MGRGLVSDLRQLRQRVTRGGGSGQGGGNGGGRFEAFDSHFHFDRTLKRMKVRPDGNSLVRITGMLSPEDPGLAVEVVGGVLVYCDPETYPDPPSVPRHPKWRVAVGIHPSRVDQWGQSELARLTHLVSYDRVMLGEIGLDWTTGDAGLWSLQEKVLIKLIPLATGLSKKVIVLHLRDITPLGEEVNARGLCILREYCGAIQPIHLHCFTGSAGMVGRWLAVFPHCYFSFAGKPVAGFLEPQLKGLRAVPGDRLLLETDSPYLSCSDGVSINTPSRIGDVARVVSQELGRNVRDVLAQTTANGRRLYQF
jgi:TatD DNase family protein